MKGDKPDRNLFTWLLGMVFEMTCAFMLGPVVSLDGPKLSRDVLNIQECGELWGRTHTNILFYSQVEMSALLTMEKTIYLPSAGLWFTHCGETKDKRYQRVGFLGLSLTACYYFIRIQAHIFFSLFIWEICQRGVKTN